MTKDISQSSSSSSPDLATLASAIQKVVAQALLDYGQVFEPETPEVEKSGQLEQTEQPECVNQAEQDEQVEAESSEEQCIQCSYNSDEGDTPDFRKSYSSIRDNYRRGEFHDEIRCYTVSASDVRKEYKLCDADNACDLPEFLSHTYDEFSIIITLLSGFDAKRDLEGSDIHLISESLSRSLDKLEVLHSQLDAFELIHIATFPKKSSS